MTGNASTSDEDDESTDDELQNLLAGITNNQDNNTVGENVVDNSGNGVDNSGNGVDNSENLVNNSETDDIDLDQEINRILHQRLGSQNTNIEPFSCKTKSITTLGSIVTDFDLTIGDLYSLTKSDQWLEDAIMDFYSQLILTHTKMKSIAILSAQYRKG